MNFKALFNMGRGKAPALQVTSLAAPTPTESRISPGSPEPRPVSSPRLQAAEEQNAAIARQVDAALRPPPEKAVAASKPEAPDLPTFESKFKKAPYYDPNRTFLVGRDFFNGFAERIQVPMFTPEEKAELHRLCEWKYVARVEMSQVSFDAVRVILNEAITRNETLKRLGKCPEMLPDQEKLKAEHAARRHHLREQLRAIRFATQPIIRGICSRLKAAARELAEQLDAQERADAAKWGVEFQPSIALQTTVWLAIDGFDQQANCSSEPDQVVFGSYNHADWEPTK
jgi:hypothetical protein